MPTASDTPVRRRLTREQRAAQLLDVAEGVFVDRGFEGASIEAIAAAAGVTRPVVYEHYESKEQMFRLLVRAARAELDETIIVSVAGIDDNEARLRAGVAAVFRFMGENRRRWALLFDRLASSGDLVAEQTALRLRTVEMIAGLIGAAAAPETERLTIDLFAHALSGAAEQIERWWREHPDIPPDVLADHLVAFAWPGLSALAEGP